MIKKEGIAHDADPVQIKFPEHRQSGTVHTIQLWFRDATGAIGAPAAGTVTIKARAPGAPIYGKPQERVIDVTSDENWLQTFNGIHLEALELTLDSVTADYTMGYAVSSSFGGA